jgi:hypothetical protein
MFTCNNAVNTSRWVHVVQKKDDNQTQRLLHALILDAIREEEAEIRARASCRGDDVSRRLGFHT